MNTQELFGLGVECLVVLLTLGYLLRLAFLPFERQLKGVTESVLVAKKSLIGQEVCY